MGGGDLHGSRRLLAVDFGGVETVDAAQFHIGADDVNGVEAAVGIVGGAVRRRVGEAGDVVEADPLVER